LQDVREEALGEAMSGWQEREFICPGCGIQIGIEAHTISPIVVTARSRLNTKEESPERNLRPKKVPTGVDETKAV